MNHSATLKPMPLWQSLILFGIPAIIAAGVHYIVWPYLVSLGLSQEDGYDYAYLIWFVGMFAAALVAYVQEGNPLNWRSFRERYRLRGMGWREWRWTLAGLLVSLLLGYILTLLAPAVYDLLDFVPPETSPSGPITNIPLYLIGLSFNILGEELWWRGYILPRQELTHGKYTWLLHGILWAFFHGFKWWAVPFMLFHTWIIPFVTQRLKNTTPGLIIHLIPNALSALIVIT